MAEPQELSREQLLALVMVQAQTIARLEAEVAELRRRSDNRASTPQSS